MGAALAGPQAGDAVGAVLERRLDRGLVDAVDGEPEVLAAVAVVPRVAKLDQGRQPEVGELVDEPA
jgi:hypothetical protein